MSNNNKKNKVINKIKKFTGKKQDFYKLSLENIRENLKKYNTPEEKYNFLITENIKIIECKIKMKQEIDKTYPQEEQINSFFPDLLGIEELEKEVDSLIKDYKKINNLKIGENPENEKKNKLSHKQQILVLFYLGFFDLPKIKELSNQKKAKIISAIINKDEKNTSDYIRYYNGKKTLNKFNCKTPANISVVNQILKEISLPEIP